MLLGFYNNMRDVQQVLNHLVVIWWSKLRFSGVTMLSVHLHLVFSRQNCPKCSLYIDIANELRWTNICHCLLCSSARESFDSSLSILNPFVRSQSTNLGPGWHWHLRISLEHTKHASPDYQKITHPLRRLERRFFALKALWASCQVLNHSNIIRLVQAILLGLTMSSGGVTIALFCPKHDIIAPKPTARMLGNLRVLGHEIV